MALLFSRGSRTRIEPSVCIIDGRVGTPRDGEGPRPKSGAFRSDTSVVALFADARGFTAKPAHVVELGPADFTAACNFNLLDRR